MSRLPDFSAPDALLPVVAQDAATGAVLMVAFMNEAAWQATLATGEATYFSRSRGRLWKKGETSGHVQRVREALVDCDGDAILLKVEQLGGAACHEGYASCFFRRRAGERWETVGERLFDPAAVYGAKDSAAQ
ncbi:MAG: phosphoribosyl-AMP cyclohydrolase [Pirellulales bacterium]|nr:phosphoribosyl-AMP cyclohydrolase [Pirellulales bacterium]